MNKLLNRTLTDMKVSIDIPIRVWTEKYGTPEYWKALERELQSEIKDLEEFIGDHRSRDHYNLGVEKIYYTTCQFCGHEYPDGYDGILDCCNKAVDLQQEEIKSLINVDLE